MNIAYICKDLLKKMINNQDFNIATIIEAEIV